MTITTTIISKSVIGNKRMVIGKTVDTDSSGNTYNNTSSDINTTLNSVEFVKATITRTTYDASGNSVDVSGNFPTTSGNIHLMYDQSGNIYWEAIGY